MVLPATMHCATIDFLTVNRRMFRSVVDVVNVLDVKFRLLNSRAMIRTPNRLLYSVWCPRTPISEHSCLRLLSRHVSSNFSESRLWEEASLQLPDDVNHVVPSNELVVYINGTYTKVKAVDLYSLIRGSNTEEILALVEYSGLQLDKTHLALSLKRLFALSTRKKYGSLPIQASELRQDHRFQILSMLLAKKARFLEPSVAADMLTFLVHFAMDTSDLAVKVYLQIVTKHVNNLSLDQLATLAHNLGQLGFSNQTETLLRAVKTLCNTRQYQLATLSVEHMIFLLTAFGAHLAYADELLRMLWTDRYEISHSRTALGVFVASATTFSISREQIAKPLRRHRKLEKWCLAAVLKQLEMLSAGEAKSLLVACKQLRLYDGKLLSAIGQRFSSAITCSLAEHLSIWLSLADLGYLHGNLSVTILDSIDSLTIRSLSTEDCISLMRVAAEKFSSNQSINRVENASLIASAIEKIASGFTGSQSPQSESALDACLYTFSLGEVPAECLVDHVLQKMNTFLSSEPIGLGLSVTDKLLLLMHLLANLETKMASDPRISDAITKVSHLQKHRSDASCLTAGFKLLQIDSTQPHVTSSGFFADHFLSRSIGEQTSDTMVLCWHHGAHFWRNTNQLLCIPRLYAQTMQTTAKCRVVVINADVWQTMSERERLEYLKQKALNNADDLVPV